MYEHRAVEKLKQAKSQNNDGEQTEENLQQIEQMLQVTENRVKQIEGLLSVIGLTIHELNQPMTILLGLSNLLGSEIEQNTPLAKDLKTIAEQARRMSEIVKEINQLTNYQSTSQANGRFELGYKSPNGSGTV